MTRKGFRSAIPNNPVYRDLLKVLCELETEGAFDKMYASSEELCRRTGKCGKVLSEQLRYLHASGYLVKQDTKGRAIRYYVNAQKISETILPLVIEAFEKAEEDYSFWTRVLYPGDDR